MRTLAISAPTATAGIRKYPGAPLKELSGLNGADLIMLFVSVRYAQRLLNNRRVRAYLVKRLPEVADELEDTVRSYLGSESFRLE